MKSLVFSNSSGTCNVEYKVDVIGSNNGNLTVMEVNGLDTSETVAGINFGQLTYTYQGFKSFAEDNNLILKEITSSGTSTIVGSPTALAIQTVTADLGAGVCADKEVTDITCVGDTTNSLDGKYFTFNTPSTGYYVWFNTSGGSAANPAVSGRTGIEVAITTGDSASAVATAARAAIAAALPSASTGVTITGATTHVIITNNAKGAVTIAAAGDSGVSISITNQGNAGTAYSETLVAEGGNTPYSWDISSGALPDGLTLNALTGEISGTPTVADTFTFTARVTDVFGVTDTESMQIVVAG